MTQTMDATMSDRMSDQLADSPTVDEAPRRRRGRRTLFVLGSGVMLVGAVWSFAAIRAGIRRAEPRAKGRRRRRRAR